MFSRLSLNKSKNPKEDEIDEIDEEEETKIECVLVLEGEHLFPQNKELDEIAHEYLR